VANAGQVRLRIRALRRSVVRRILAANAIDAALIAGVLLAAIACMRHLAGVAPLPHPWPAAVLLVALLAALLRTARQWPDLATTARLFDAAASSRDRIGTALALDGRPNLAPMERVALAECARFTREFNPRPHLASRCPRRAAALLVPLASAGIICWDAAVRRPTPEATPGARAAVHRVADVLEDLSRDLAST